MTQAAKSYDVSSPSKLAHVVIRTWQFTEQREFYKKFLGASPGSESTSVAFLRYDEEHHCIGIIKYKDLTDSSRRDPSLEHIAFTSNNSFDLLKVWQQKKALVIEPV